MEHGLKPQSAIPIDRLPHPARAALAACGSAVALLLLLAGCASTPQASREREEEAKRFEPVTRDAVIYIYRPGTPTTTPETTVWVDGRLVGESLPGTFFRVIVFPGRNRIDTSPPDTGRIDVNTLPSDIAYVEMRTRGTRGSPTTTFRVMPADEAQRTIIACCRMFETWHYNQPRLLW